MSNARDLLRQAVRVTEQEMNSVQLELARLRKENAALREQVKNLASSRVLPKKCQGCLWYIQGKKLLEGK